MVNDDYSGAIDSEDVIVNAVRAIKAFPSLKSREVLSEPAPQLAKETPDDAKKARELGFSEGMAMGKRQGYLEALKHVEIYIKAMNV